MINKEMIEDAANKYLQTELELERVLGLEYIESDVVKENILTDFKAGAEWAIEQMSNDAIEFAEWTLNSSVRILTIACTDIGIKWIHDGAEYTSQELYRLYLNSKTK